MKLSNKLSLVAVSLQIAGVLAHPAQGADLVGGETHYNNGMAAMDAKNFALCADELFLAKTTDDQKNKRAKLYLAYCQVQLGNKQYAALNLNTVQAADFRGTDRVTYRAMANELKSQLDALNPMVAWAMPFMAIGQYSSTSSKSSLIDAGVAGGLGQGAWSGTLSAEYLKIKMRDAGVSGYSQKEVAASVSHTINPNFWARANLTYLNTNAATLGNTYVGGATLGYIPSVGTQVSAEYEYSSYPNLSLGALKAHQITPAIDQALLSTADTLVHLTAGEQMIFASAPQKSDPFTQFDLKSSYFRSFFGLEYRHQKVVLGLDGWFGKEAFGVRNGGAVIYNAIEEHKSGFGARVGYQIQPKLYLQGSVSRESFTASGVSSNLTVESLSLLFNF